MVKTAKMLALDVARKTGYITQSTEEIIRCFEDMLIDCVYNGDTVRIGPVEFGTKLYPASAGKNPKNGEPYISPEHRVPYSKVRFSFKMKYLEDMRGTK